MSYDSIWNDLNKKKYKPVYWLEGEEDYFIDRISDYIEKQVLTDAEKEFNLTVFYGRDTKWNTVVNACRRYPMFSEKQVVIIKEAQAMDDLDKLEVYLENPLPSTILVVAHKQGKVDGRSKLAKIIKEKAECLTTKKLNDNQLPDWIEEYVRQKNFTITQKAVLLLADHIGNDLSRISHETDKLLINITDKKNIDEGDIEKYVGISREYNVFELQRAIGKKDMAKTCRIIQYFEANPKAGPMPMIMVSLYNFFAKVYLVAKMRGASDKDMAAAAGVSPYFLKEYQMAAHAYGAVGVEKNILLLHEYNLRKLGVNDAFTNDGDLLKEMVFKMVNG